MRDTAQVSQMLLAGIVDFEAIMASSHDGTYPCDLLQGLVPLRVPTFILRGDQLNVNYCL